MSSAEASKTEKPTPKKLKDAKKEGNVTYSNDLSMFVAVATMIFGLFFRHDYIVASLAKNYVLVFQQISSQQFGISSLCSITMQILSSVLSSIIPLTILAAIAAMLASIIQLGGLVLKEELFEFDLKSFNLVENAKQVLSKKNLTKFLFNSLKLFIMFSIAFCLIKANLRQIILLVTVPLWQMLKIAAIIIFKIITGLLATYFVFALLDLIVEKRALYKQLMMSRDEIEKEQEETEGNKEIKQRLRELRQEMLVDEDETFAQYKDSLLVLANPTHIAIILLYLPRRWGLPITLFKAKGYKAQHIFKLARIYKVPLIRDKWLARQMYEFALLYQFIPSSLVKDIAEIIARNLSLMPKVAADIEFIKKNPPLNPPVVRPNPPLFNMPKGY